MIADTAASTLFPEHDWLVFKGIGFSESQVFPAASRDSVISQSAAALAAGIAAEMAAATGAEMLTGSCGFHRLRMRRYVDGGAPDAPDAAADAAAAVPEGGDECSGCRSLGDFPLAALPAAPAADFPRRSLGIAPVSAWLCAPEYCVRELSGWSGFTSTTFFATHGTAALDHAHL
ncbi:unnamed protein product [Closterium sp. Yama58-4]|nr:unnamed protein product [Closterium sp. Yama58-4]